MDKQSNSGIVNFIDASAELGVGTEVGHFTIIGPRVRIGRNCRVGNNVTIHRGTRIGDNVRVDDGTVIGKLPMKAVISATTKEETLSPTVIGDDCLIGTSAVIYAGAAIGPKVLVADLATVREKVVIGEATIVGRGAAIEGSTKIGSRCKIETNVYITAYSEIEDYAFVAPCVATSNDNFVGRTKERFKHYKGVTVKRGGRLGVNSTILPGKVIGEDSLVAAGALVTKDAPPRKIVAGSPAKVFRDVPDEQLLENQ
jgi:UDP-2-acetamido-3-amino-2,3-dideoxy-glucuronate N-acetyltransferase